MADYTLYIGNKNYSSWSLRAWLALVQTGAAFDEEVIPLDEPQTRQTLQEFSPSGRVPVLHHGDLVIWESLAIAEYLAERHPDCGLLPTEPVPRAICRAVSAEMHSSFRALRTALPMNIRSRFPNRPVPSEARTDINRIVALWRDCRRRFGTGGDFLFGDFCLADAMYAPVVTRLRTYAIEVNEETAQYMEAVWSWPAMQRWAKAAGDEPMVIESAEF